MKLSRIAFGLGATALVVACSSTPASDEPQISDQMQEAIDTYVRFQTADVDGGAGTSGGGGSLGGIDAVKLGGALKAGATTVPYGGAASGPTNAGSGGAGAPSLVGGAGGPLGAGNGGAAVGPSGVGGGSTSFAEAACYMISNLCRYVGRCSVEGLDEAVCRVPSTCPSVVATAISRANVQIPPQAAPIMRCFGDALGSASCVRGDLGEGLGNAFGRCGISIPRAR